MKKINYILLVFISLLVVFASCNRPMTYAERLRAEGRAISQFIAENNFVILRDFPSDTIFGENEFFRDPATGVYFNIVSRGLLFDEDGNRFDENFNLLTEGTLDRIDLGREETGRELYVRFRGLNYFMMPNDTILHSNDRAHDPIEMVFRGPVTRQNRDLFYRDGVPAFIVPLQHIGYGARVRLIVPFSMGFPQDRVHPRFQPAFFEEVDYIFERPWHGSRSTE